MIWHPRHHVPIAALVLLFLSLAVVRLLSRPVTLPEPLATLSSISLRLDPNTASEHDLAAIPGIGTARARALIEYRNTHRKPTDPPLFTSLESLRTRKLLRSDSLRRAAPYLKFPSPPDSDLNEPAPAPPPAP